MPLTPQPHPVPTTLDELLANARHFAEFCMNHSGHVTPALFFIGDGGQGMLVPEGLSDGESKDEFATQCRLVCIARAVTACVMVLEAWAKFAKPGEAFDLAEPPSEAFDRQEYVILMGESRAGNNQRFLPIVRSDNGKFFGFGDPYEPEADMSGRFARLLPPKVPDAAARQLALAALQARGAAHTRGRVPSPLRRGWRDR